MYEDVKKRYNKILKRAKSLRFPTKQDFKEYHIKQRKTEQTEELRRTKKN